MQINSLLWMVVCYYSVTPIVHSVVQYKVRGPPIAQRLPHMPHYPKTKWPTTHRQTTHRQTTHRPTTRPYMRPIPVQMASYKVPVIARPPKTPAPLIFPSAVWKTPTAIYRPPVEKPFLTSPPVTQSYEFHLNKDPILSVPTIKQIGEKGPIHTIPAPNLSPADKPNVILEEPVQKHTYQYVKQSEVSPNSISPLALTNTILGAQALPLIQSHKQYQVTENMDPADQLVQNQYNPHKTYYAPDPGPNSLISQLPHLSDTSLANSVKLFATDLFMSPQQYGVNTGTQMSAQDLYQLLNGIPQQQLLDNYGTPLLQQPQVQQHFVQSQTSPTNYQSMLNSASLFQQESPYFNHIPAVTNQHVKDNFKPQFHTFNYEEQSSRNVPSKGYAQSRVTADYNLEPEVAENTPTISVQAPNEALARTQYIQQYFTTQDNTVNENNDVESNLPTDTQDNTKEASELLTRLSIKKEISPSMFYSSLPSREAAEALASLQAAGSVNSNIIKLAQTRTEKQSTKEKEQMRIYVPDENENYDDMETQSSDENAEVSNENINRGIKIYETTYLDHNKDNKNDSVEYEDYSNEDDNSKNDSSNEFSDKSTTPTQIAYGSRLKIKNNNTR